MIMQTYIVNSKDRGAPGINFLCDDEIFWVDLVQSKLMQIWDTDDMKFMKDHTSYKRR